MGGGGGLTGFVSSMHVFMFIFGYVFVCLRMRACAHASRLFLGRRSRRLPRLANSHFLGPYLFAPYPCFVPDSSLIAGITVFAGEMDFLWRRGGETTPLASQSPRTLRTPYSFVLFRAFARASNTGRRKFRPGRVARLRGKGGESF